MRSLLAGSLLLVACVGQPPAERSGVRPLGQTADPIACGDQVRFFPSDSNNGYYWFGFRLDPVTVNRKITVSAWYENAAFGAAPGHRIFIYFTVGMPQYSDAPAGVGQASKEVPPGQREPIVVLLERPGSEMLYNPFQVRVDCEEAGGTVPEPPGQMGGGTVGCSCEADCWMYDSCCDDCSANESSGTSNPSCYCDDACINYNDCCDDCPASNPSGGGSTSCYCDDLCSMYHDCCDDCGGFGGGGGPDPACYCDSVCQFYGDCCDYCG